MAKVKIARKSTTIDMTAMCDVAFLLLTFFMLTTKFRPQELAQINIPASTAQIPIPDDNILLIQVTDQGKVYMGVDDQITREAMLFKMKERYQLPELSAEQVNSFKLMDAFGMPVEQLPQFLSMESAQRNAMQQPGIMMDSTNNQLGELVMLARQSNNDLRIAIKADANTDYEKVNKVIQTLQERKVNKFNLITSARGTGEAKE
jgi:biopolymer transport protein ExbD